MKRVWKRGMALLLSAVMGLSLAACGGEQSDAENYVYVPERVSVGTTRNDCDGSVLAGDRMYYLKQVTGGDTIGVSAQICYRQADDMEKEEALPMESLPAEGADVVLKCFTADDAGNLYVVRRVLQREAEDGEAALYLSKYDSSLQEVFSKSLSAVLSEEDGENITALKVSPDGIIYGAGDREIQMFDAAGEFVRTISLQTDYMVDFAVNTDGAIYFYEDAVRGEELTIQWASMGDVGKEYHQVPESHARVKVYDNDRLLLIGNSKLYEYHVHKQESREILTWMDCNIDGRTVQDCLLLDDGRVLAVCRGQGDATEFVVLTQQNSAGEEKEVIVVATLCKEEGQLKEAVINFNKESKKYRIKLKSYIDSTGVTSQSQREDALARLNADLASENRPDIIELDYLDWRNLAEKGILEDLTPYMKKSKEVKSKHFVSSVLEAYQVDGMQVTIPVSFTVYSLMGKSGMVGDEPGWTMEEMMAAAEKYPQAQLTDSCRPDMVLSYSMYYCVEKFVDAEAGTCNFDSPEFIEILEFANKYQMKSTSDSLPIQLQKGQALLGEVSMHAPYMMQMYWQVFAEQPVCIGYPTVDGSPCTTLHCYQKYGMVAQSEHKEGAWDFMESLLAEEGGLRALSLPSRKALLQEEFEKAMEPDYVYVNGKIAKDENGEKMQYPKNGYFGYEDWKTELYAATKEEIAVLEEAIEAGKVPGAEYQAVSGIITEEAQAYFEGMKSAQEVAAIIQNRVKLYMDENYVGK